MPVLLLLWLNEFSFPPPIIIEILLNMAWFKRDRQRRMIRFRRRTNRRKITKWWDTNRPARIYNRHYTDIFTSVPNHCPLYVFFVLLQFVCPVHIAMLHLLQFLRLASHPKTINTTTKNIPLRSVKIDLMHSHILPLIDVVQVQCTYLHMTINKRHS